MPITEKTVLQALRRALPDSSIRIDGNGDETPPVAVLPDGSRVELVLRWAGEGYPRDIARELTREPLTAPVSSPGGQQQHEVFCARSISEGSRKVIEALGASWVALDGSASLHIGTVWVERVPGPGLVAEEVGFEWSAARAEIAEVLIAVVVDASRTHGAVLGVLDAPGDRDRLGAVLGACALRPSGQSRRHGRRLHGDRGPERADAA